MKVCSLLYLVTIFLTSHTYSLIVRSKNPQFIDGGNSLIKTSQSVMGGEKLPVARINAVKSPLANDDSKCGAFETYIQTEAVNPDICKLCELGLVHQFSTKKIFRQGDQLCNGKALFDKGTDYAADTEDRASIFHAASLYGDTHSNADPYNSASYGSTYRGSGNGGPGKAHSGIIYYGEGGDGLGTNGAAGNLGVMYSGLSAAGAGIPYGGRPGNYGGSKKYEGAGMHRGPGDYRGLDINGGPINDGGISNYGTRINYRGPTNYGSSSLPDAAGISDRTGMPGDKGMQSNADIPGDSGKPGGVRIPGGAGQSAGGRGSQFETEGNNGDRGRSRGEAGSYQGNIMTGWSRYNKNYLLGKSYGGMDGSGGIYMPQYIPVSYIPAPPYSGGTGMYSGAGIYTGAKLYRGYGIGGARIGTEIGRGDEAGIGRGTGIGEGKGLGGGSGFGGGARIYSAGTGLGRGADIDGGVGIGGRTAIADRIGAETDIDYGLGIGDRAGIGGVTGIGGGLSIAGSTGISEGASMCSQIGRTHDENRASTTTENVSTEEDKQDENEVTTSKQVNVIDENESYKYENDFDSQQNDENLVTRRVRYGLGLG